MNALFNTSLRRFKLGKVALVVFGASICLFLMTYLVHFVGDDPFNWVAYREYFPNQLLGTIATTFFSYLTLNHFHYLFSHYRSLHHFIIPVLLCVLSIEAYNLVVDKFMPLKNNIEDPIPFEKQVVGNLLVAVMYILFVLVLSYVHFLRDVKRNSKKLEEQKLKLEVEKMQADMKFLKSQINPHFLHNTLNSFYARSLPLSKDLADGILTLSEMMRYALGDAYNTDGKVLLKDEIDHVRNLIRINQFRFRNHLNVQLEVKGETNQKVIIPFILITLVENIFKHGALSDIENPILICIEIDHEGLRYHSKNKKKTGPKELSTGIGIDNIRKRLDLAYNNAYKLDITEDNEYYITGLSIEKL